MRAAVYVRMSQDRTGADRGLERQEQDFRKLCDRLSWKVAEVCRDNDVSAYSGKTRPDWERLLADVRAGDIDAIVCTSRSMSDTTASLHAQRVLFQPAETRAFAKILDTRSVGVRDLRYGSIVDEDWCDVDPDEFLQDRCREVPFLAGTAYYFIAVTVTKESDGPLATVLGDLFVQYPSASGRGSRRCMPFEIEHGRHLGRLHHFDLLNHPEVYAHMRRWFAGV